MFIKQKLNTNYKLLISLILFSIGVFGQGECKMPLYQRDSAELLSLLELAPEAEGANEELELFESSPGAKNVIYLDFDGEEVTNNWWTQHVEGSVINAAPASYFTTSEKLSICKAVAADFQPWDVNVTTIRSLHDNHDFRNRVHVIFTNTNFYPGSPGGVAKSGSFASSGSIAWVFQTSPSQASNSASHEIGHTFGLEHDGKGSSEYYWGHGDWAPIMGSSSKVMAQWSKGEYSSATNTSDDYVRLDQYLTRREDDWSSSLTEPSNLGEVMLDNINVSGDGLISETDDTDIFIFSTSGGMFSLDFGCEEGGNATNLRIEAAILDVDGNVIISNETVNTSKVINTWLPTGTYYLQFDGVGYRTVNTGYSDYNSLGRYQFSGSVENLISTNDLGFVSIQSLNKVTCSETIESQISVKNYGSESTSEFNVNIKNQDGILLASKNVSTPISAGATMEVEIEFTPTNFKEFSFIAELDWAQDQIAENNLKTSLETQYMFGENIELEIPVLIKSNQLKWELTDKIDGRILFDSDDLEHVELNAIHSQAFCIPKDSCFDIEITTPFKSENDWCFDPIYYKYTTVNNTNDHIYYPGDTVQIIFSPGAIYEVNSIINQTEMGMIFSPDLDDRLDKLSCIDHEANAMSLDFLGMENEAPYFNEPYSELITYLEFELCANNEITSVNDNLSDFNLIAYPNPATDLVHFKSNEAVKSIEVYSLSGALVLSQANSSKINIASLPIGSYFFKVETDVVSHHKILKIK